MPHRGFTLIELLITILILIILVTLAAPGMAGLLRHNRTQVTAHELFQALQLARLEAVRRNDRATIRPLGDSWQEGWVVFADPEHSGRLPDESEFLALGSPKKGVRVSANRPLRDHVSFLGTGESRRSGGGQNYRGAFLAGTFTVCPEQQGRGYQLVLARGGRVRMERIDTAACGF